MSKKIKNALKVGLGLGAAYLARKAMMDKGMPTDAPDLGSEAANVSRNIAAETENVRSAIPSELKKMERAKKIASMGDTSDFGDELMNVGQTREGMFRNRMERRSGPDTFKKGGSVMARGCKLGRKKKTKLY